MYGMNLLVLNKFALYSGQKPEDVAIYEDICDNALEEVLADLSDSTNIQAHKTRICCVAAALALYHFTLQREIAQDGSNITVGNVSIGGATMVNADSAYRFYSQLRLSAKNLFKDDCFYFGRVTV